MLDAILAVACRVLESSTTDGPYLSSRRHILWAGVSHATKRRDRIVEAHLAIQQRLAEGLSREKDSTELVAIDNALAALRVLLTIESADPEV